jgi:hypothetical protein
MKDKKPSPGPISTIVEVYWFDAHSRGGWDSVESYLEHDIAPVVTVGYLLRETKKSITITQTQGIEQNDVNGAIAIPLSWIVKKKVLRK